MLFTQVTINSLIAGAIYSLLALGFNFIYGPTKFFNLAHGAVSALAGFLVFTFINLKLPLFACVALGAFSAGLAGWLLDRLIYYPLRKGDGSGLWPISIVTALGAGYGVYYLSLKIATAMELSTTSSNIFGPILGIIAGGWLFYVFYKASKKMGLKVEVSGLVLLVASLGAMTVIESALALGYGSHFRSFSDSVTATSYPILGGTITSIHLFILGTALVLSVALHWVLTRTTFGKAVRAITDDAEVAYIVGIRTERVIGWTFFIGSAMAGLAGILVSFDIGLEPTMGMNLLLKAAIASIIGGIGSMPGAIAGGFLLGGVENFGIWKLSSEWKEAIAFALLIVFLIWRPKGIFKR